MSDADFATILLALGRHGVLRFPDQRLEAVELRDFSRRFGRIQATLTGRHHEPGMPEVGYLSNIIENGEPIGITDAGQDWHTDMSYNETIGFLNVLYAVKVPRRDGQVLGATAVRQHAGGVRGSGAGAEGAARERDGHPRLQQVLGEHARAGPGSLRGPLTAEQRRRRPPSVHPLFLTHPITGRRVLYCNPGYAIRINELDEAESDRVLETLFAHQLQPKYQYTHRWTEGDVLMWDHIGTLHNAIADYRPDEHRLMKRCQVMADRDLRPSVSARGPIACLGPRGRNGEVTEDRVMAQRVLYPDHIEPLVQFVEETTPEHIVARDARQAGRRHVREGHAAGLGAGGRALLRPAAGPPRRPAPPAGGAARRAPHLGAAVR